jgi:hypothetical protein
MGCRAPRGPAIAEPTFPGQRMHRILAGCWLTLACAGGAWSEEALPDVSELPMATPPAARPATPLPVERPAPEAPTPLATRQTSFTIPFAVDPGAAREVQLHVTRDQGRNWSLYARQTPESGHFLFRAAEDGEYWFASQTIDLQGRPLGGETLAPELRVRIDTTTPRTELAARVGPAGEIIAQWHAHDDDLVEESLLLEYQGAGERQWRSVPRDSQGLTGEATWTPTTNHRAISLRFVARDGAGNTAVVNRGVYLPASRGARTEGKQTSPLSVDPFRRDDLKVSQQPPQRWPAENESAATTAPAESARPDSLRPEEALPPFRPVAAPVESPVASSAQNPAARGSSEASPQSPFDRPFSSDPGEPSAAASVAPATAGATLPEGEQASFTKSRRFKLHYDADDIPPEQIAAVELWGTHDGGQNWVKWGVDPDRQSPFEVEVEQDGIFGFRIVVVHQNGMAGHTPRGGDAADLWVGVDSTPPVARFAGVTFGKGTHAGQLRIQWQASDDWLSPRPVTLSYAVDPQGPWSALATGLAHTGQYFWRVDPTIPRKIYLRLEVHDQAGNVTEDRLQEAVELEGLVPRGRIRGLE